MFGTIPYKRAWYLDVADSDSSGMKSLIEVLSKLKDGNLASVAELLPLLSHSELDVRLYAQQLFADVCSHEQVRWFDFALEAAKTSAESRRIILRLGQSLSLAAVPILLDWLGAADDSETDEYVCHALSDIFPISGVDHLLMSRTNIRTAYEDAILGLDSLSYYYKGKKLHVGDVAKELIVASTVAFKEKGKVILVIQPQILSNFSGKKCPVCNGQLIGERDMENVFSYLEAIAGIKWNVGSKYFFRHEITQQ